MSTMGIIILCSILGVVILFLLWMELWPWHIMRLSTLRALKWLGLRQAITGGAHGMFYGRWGPQYIKTLRTLAKVFGRRGRAWMEYSYHGKVLPHELARAVIKLDHEVPLQDLGDQVIPYKRAREIILNENTSYALTDCMCKRDRKDHQGKPCKVAQEPYQTCMLVGDPGLCDFLVDHKPKVSMKLTREQALAKLEEFHDMGLVHNAWFKSCLKDRFYAICNCCTCCCLGMETMRRGIRQLTSSGYVARTDEKKCRGCGTCVSICPFNAIELVTVGKKTRAVVNWDRCYGCGVCVDKCPAKAKEFSLDSKKGLPMDVRKLVKQAGKKNGISIIAN